ncbi:hypothetical protein MACK_003613 [Theileria orientalis]|uniref:Uncharacterized protein n=1 Tax=Theileria orientalis TaxID=68886 RepID=A0A976SJE9_THEOR|nr:hypothetical protein MACK_003613 [Theileria orientalis]
MNKRSSDRKWIFEDGPESLFWDSQLYRKSDFKNRKNKSFRYYDETSFLKYLFYHWVNKWAFMLSKKYIEPYKYHPLPSSDQILKWYPIFSKHVSDGLVRLDSYHYAKSQSRDTKAKKPYKSILLRALFLTIWKRALVLIVGLIVVNVSNH